MTGWRTRSAVALALIALPARLLTVTAVETRGSSADQTEVGEAIAARLASPAPPLGAFDLQERLALQVLYGAAPSALWIDSYGAPTSNVASALELFDDAETHGLDPEDYGAVALRELGRLLGAEATSNGLPARRGDFDVAMSAAALRYVRHLHLGRIDPRELGFQLDVAPDQHDFPAVLRAALSNNALPELAASLEPPLAQYRYLRDALVRYRALAATSGNQSLDLSGVVHPGDQMAAPALQGVAQRLALVGDLEPSAVWIPRTTYDAILTTAIRRFQTRHGLEADGIIGSATLAALQVPIDWRRRQIELALERLRWLPDLTGERVIALNIPMFQLWAWNAARPDGVPELGMRAIVGRAMRTETPVFVSEVREVVFRPPWNVPRSIVTSEILPELRDDAGYLERHDMEIVRGPDEATEAVPATADNLALLARGALRLRQRPGPNNALGLVKFVFPNSDDVYLHGTPAQELFAATRRDFSHGCVRLENPIALAEWVLGDQATWTRHEIMTATSGPSTRHVRVERPVQVVLFYLTATVSPEDRTVHFAEDLYRHDAALDRALAAARRP